VGPVGPVGCRALGTCAAWLRGLWPPQIPGLKPWVMIGKKWSGGYAACFGKRTEVRGLGAPVPQRLEVFKEGAVYDQMHRGSASRGLQSPFMSVPLWAHYFFPIIAQDFSPGRPCAWDGL